MYLTPYLELWTDWIIGPLRSVIGAVHGAALFTLHSLAYVPAFVQRHLLHPPRVHMFPERLFTLVSRLVRANLAFVLLIGVLVGRLLNGGLILLPGQQLVFVYAVRSPVTQLTLEHLLPATVSLLLIARAGTGIAMRTTLARLRGVWPRVEEADSATLARAFDLLVIPRALATGMTSAILGLAAIAGLTVGFALEPGTVRFAAGVTAFVAGLGEFLRMAGISTLAWSLLKTGFMGAAIGFVSCYEGLRGEQRTVSAYQVIGRTFSNTLAACILTDLWMSLAAAGLVRWLG